MGLGLGLGGIALLGKSTTLLRYFPFLVSPVNTAFHGVLIGTITRIMPPSHALVALNWRFFFYEMDLLLMY